MAIEIRAIGWTARGFPDVQTVEAVEPSSTVEVTGGKSADPYTGPYTVEPSDAVQTLETAGKFLASDVTVAPIPSNYGRIEWNGSVLRVS